MTTKEVADRLVSLCSQGQFDNAAEELYGENIVSVEAASMGDAPREMAGMEAIRGKMAWWNSTFEVESAKVEGPWINEPFFATRFIMDAKNRHTGEAMHMEEIAVYQVENGKIVHERFF